MAACASACSAKSPPTPAARRCATPENIQARFDDGICCLREVARILAVLYGTRPRQQAGPNRRELVYIILAGHTREGAYQQAFDLLKQRFPRWDDLIDIPPRIIRNSSGPAACPAKKRWPCVRLCASCVKEFGRCTLETARDWSDEKLEEFLCSLPEIQQKSAFCIMMYSFGRQVFPADTHVGRVLSRVGPYRELGLSLEGRDHKQLRRGATRNPIPPGSFSRSSLDRLCRLVFNTEQIVRP